MSTPVLLDEAARLEALRRLQILDTPREDAYDDLTHLAALVCEAPIATITLVDEDRQWFKSQIGLQSSEGPRAWSFCAHAIEGEEMFVVPDARDDERFATNPLVTGDPYIRFYAGMPIAAPGGQNVGTLCVIDRQPRKLSESGQVALRVLARQVGALFRIREQMEQLEQAAARQAEIERRLRDSQGRLLIANQRLQDMVRTDALTGLGNRRLFSERLRQEWKLSQRLGFPLSLLMVDIDHFKRINDSAGHPAGDLVLQHVAALLEKATRESDTCTRYGGEEFALLLPATAQAQAVRIADLLRETIAGAPCGEFSITVSIGIATGVALPDGDASMLLARADAALYAAKAAGRNRVECAAD